MKLNPPGTPDPRVVPELKTLLEFVGTLTSNAVYMVGELGRLPDPPETKERIAKLCGELTGLAYDLRTEVHSRGNAWSPR